MGDAEKFGSDVAFLIFLPKEGAVEKIVYGLAMMWVHPYQARVSPKEEAIKQLNQLAPYGPNWPYALVLIQWGYPPHAPLLKVT